MTRRLFAIAPFMLAIVLAVGLAGASTSPAGAKQDRLTTSLTGAAEVPGPGDPDGSGRARLTLNPDKGQICYKLAVKGIDPATAAHIHVGEAGVAGPVVVNLTPPTNTSRGCVVVDSELVRDILRNPENYYVNVHNAPFPGGAVRGQLSK